MPKDDSDPGDQATDASWSFDLEAVKKAESEAAREARRQYKKSPTRSQDIKSTILAYLEAMGVPARERAESAQDDATRAHLIEQLDDSRSLLSVGPSRGDTCRSIIEAVQDMWPGTPEKAIRDVWRNLVEDKEVLYDKAASKRLGDKVWRRSPPASVGGWPTTQQAQDDEGEDQPSLPSIPAFEGESKEWITSTALAHAIAPTTWSEHPTEQEKRLALKRTMSTLGTARSASRAQKRIDRDGSGIDSHGRVFGMKDETVWYHIPSLSDEIPKRLAPTASP